MKKKRKGTDIGIILIGLMVIFLSCTVGIIKKVNVQKEILSEVKAQVASVKQENKEMEDEVAELEEEMSALLNQKEELLKEIADSGLSTEEKESKYAYLTFDDGPSQNTIKILDFLKANNIKATFFVIEREKQGEIYRRIVEEGHTIAIHSSSHDYATIYQSVEKFMSDIENLASFIEKETGTRPEIMRFPGGSNNTVSRRYGGADVMDQIIPAINEAGYMYFDWNVDSMDAAKVHQDKNIIVQSVIEGAKNKHEAIILMHDASAKTTTVEALPEIVQGLRNQGFSFRPLTAETSPIQFKEIKID